MATKKIALCGLFAAITAVVAQISIPIGPVPINFAAVSVFIEAGVLGGRYGSLSQMVYVLLGAVGLPVFAGFTGGVGHIAGPTGGYIVSYIIMALVAGLLIRSGKKLSNKRIILGLTIGQIIQYIIGTFWYCFVTKTHWLSALMVCVVPFIIGDIIKIIISTAAIKKLAVPFKMIIK